ncbi:putative Fungal-specific transcription factor domain-containing protein [Seiridium cardinale]|uniref:Fungal-specific transcription factor domain-containing protein n=1 Tax=Seiridium cardinale TaxID=138064 RepID=A0ABR2Y5Y0_9PEZI
MPKKNLESCWTCRLRHKKCDETRPTCRTCADLGLSCYSSETRPNWLDGGSRQQAVAQRLKAEVKTKARQRRGQKALRRIQANLLDASGSAESNNGPTPPPSTASPILSEQFQPSQQYTTIAASSPIVASSTAFLAGPTLPTLSAAHEYDIGLVITYLDHVFPLLFPFYQPQILEGGRTWLLSAIAKNEGVRRSTNSLSSYILCVVPCHSRPISQACLVLALEGVQGQRDLTVSHLQSDLRQLNNCGVHDDLFKSTGLLNSIVHLLDIERTMAAGEEWQIHLRAALGLFEEILQRPNRPQVSQWASVLSQLSVVSHPFGFPLWTAEQAAFRFSAENLVIDDIIASTSLDRPPMLINYYTELLQSDTNNPSKTVLQLTRINGCQNWVMSLLAEISVLNSWKKDQRRTLSPYIDMLSHRAHEIQSRLQDGLLRLDPSNEASGDATFLDGSAPGSMPPTSVVTRLWAYAALAYLHVILSGWQPLKEEIRNAVARGIQLLHELSSSVRHLRAQAWPYCIIGCMALESERPLFRDLGKRLGPLAKFGSIGVTMNILENIWTNSPPADSGNWDIATCLNLLGHPVLLV